MSNYLFPKLTLAVFFAALSVPVFSQAAPSATEGGLPLVVGGGFSDFDTDFGTVRLEGAAVWVDWDLYGGPSFLQGFGLEVEGRDIHFGKPANTPQQFRFDTAEGGVIYTWRRYRHLHPYGKFLLGYGVIEFPDTADPYYTHDSRSVIAPGGGLEYSVYRNISVRGDYEYQFWPQLFGPHALNPNGFTVGATYDFRYRRHSR
jgi:opacity protein-like surface antigen